MKDAKVLTIQDFSSYGQCSISVALPIISAMGSETVALPVALLSTHTSEFKNYTYVDLCQNLLPSAKHIAESGAIFDYIYIGYLGKSKVVEETEKIINLCKNAVTVVDPAMAEGGKLYDGISLDYVADIIKLCKKSYLSLPNYSEACLMADTKYIAHPDDSYIDKICSSLIKKGINRFAITGVSTDKGLCVIYQNGTSREFLPVKEIQGKYYGAGDVFSSVVVGSLANGYSVKDSLLLAIDFTHKAIELTSQDKDHWYGLKFEKALPYLISKMHNGKSN